MAASQYIRGGSAGAVDARTVLRRLAAVALGCLLAAGAVLVWVGTDQRSQTGLVRSRGVPVEATVTGCVSISSGIGMSIEYWQCQGSYALRGRRYSGVIHGSRQLLEQGQVVAAVAVPGRPDLLSTPGRAAAVASATGEYAGAAACFATGVAGAAALLWTGRGRRRR